MRVRVGGNKFEIVFQDVVPFLFNELSGRISIKVKQNLHLRCIRDDFQVMFNLEPNYVHY